MPASMTGFGVAERRDSDLSVEVELRSVNHRHLDIRFRPGIGVPALESRMLRRLRQGLERGHLEVRVRVTATGAARALHVDLDRAAAWHGAVESIAHRLHLLGSVTSLDVARLPGVVEPTPSTALLGDHADLACSALEAALAALVADRRAEGERLVADLRARLAGLGELTDAMTELAEGRVDARRAALRERLERALHEVGDRAEPGRLEQELAYIADRIDIHEELVRLRAHLDACAAALAELDCPGRKLGFLCQEILRELNTVGSKAAEIAIIAKVVAAKVEVEKLREQALNLE